MGIKAIWSFFQNHGIEGESVNYNELTTRFDDHDNKPLLVDFVGLFHETIQRHFLLVEQPDYDKASEIVLSEAHILLPKTKCILFVNGFHTVERNRRSFYRNRRRRDAYHALIKKIRQTESPDDLGLPEIKEMEGWMDEVFHVSIRMKKSLVRVANQLGWKAVYSQGDADLDMAKQGGYVITNDSDLFFFPKIRGIIFPTEHRGKFSYYDKNLILSTLGLSEEKWITLGTISANDFNPFQMHLHIENTYKLLADIGDFYSPGAIEHYIEQVSLKFHIVLNENETRISNYRIAYQIFVKMEQHLMDHNNIAEYYEDIVVQKPLLRFLKEIIY